MFKYICSGVLVDGYSGVEVEVILRVDHWTMQITGHAVGVQPVGYVSI